MEGSSFLTARTSTATEPLSSLSNNTIGEGVGLTVNTVADGAGSGNEKHQESTKGVSDADSIRVEVLASQSPVEGEFSGWGSVAYLSIASPVTQTRPSHKGTLSQAAATAIAANDVVGSMLYTLGVTTLVAGKLAPLALLLVGLTLVFPFKGIVGEVGRRIPLNGGIYSCVLLAGSKGLASVAACCSILDYVSTAVVSAASAAAYFYFEFGTINQYWAVIIVLAVFGILTMFGVRESA
ncbi:UNVERIFIED_CONTAM: hypothetical protein HDU68_002183, partial [Siphonaria sp. JEL0065]